MSEVIQKNINYKTLYDIVIAFLFGSLCNTLLSLLATFFNVPEIPLFKITDYINFSPFLNKVIEFTLIGMVVSSIVTLVGTIHYFKSFSPLIRAEKKKSLTLYIILTHTGLYMGLFTFGLFPFIQFTFIPAAFIIGSWLGYTVDYPKKMKIIYSIIGSLTLGLLFIFITYSFCIGCKLPLNILCSITTIILIIKGPSIFGYDP